MKKNMKNYITKTFGAISFENVVFDYCEENPKRKFANVEYNNEQITIFLNEYLYINKINMCLDIIEKYNEINVIAKNYILDKYLYKHNNCFRCYFEYFKNKRFARRINFKCSKQDFEHPVLHIKYNKNNEIIIQICYFLNYNCRFGRSGILLCVTMNEQLNIIDFYDLEVYVN